MANTKQISSLVASEVCQNCANCCKILRLWVENNEGLIERLRLLDSKIISYKRTEIQIYGTDYLFLDILQPCSQLIIDGEKYSCKIWDSESKPELCRNYPSNQFVLFGNKQMIREKQVLEHIIAANSSFCPAIATLTIDQVIKDQEDIFRNYL
jgi:Fe-S-cluster containining protein